MSVVHRNLSHHPRESDRRLSTRHNLPPKQISQCRTAHCARMEWIENSSRLFDFFTDSQRTTRHHNSHYRFTRLSQSCNQSSLITLQIQISQTVSFTRKNRFFTHKSKNDICTCSGGSCSSHTYRIFLTTICQSRFINHLYFIANHFLNSVQRSLSTSFLTIKYPSTQLFIRCISHRSYHCNSFHRWL